MDNIKLSKLEEINKAVATKPFSILEKGVIFSLENKDYSYFDGRRLVYMSVRMNSPKATQMALERYPWQANTDWIYSLTPADKVFNNPGVEFTEESYQLYNGFHQITSDTSMDTIEALISGGELKFIEELEQPNSMPSMKGARYAVQSLKSIYELARKTNHFVQIMDGIRSSLESLSENHSMEGLADMGIFDGDNQSGFKAWQLSHYFDEHIKTKMNRI